MSDEYATLYNAAINAMEQLERVDCTGNVVFYAHPFAIKDAMKSESVYVGFGEEMELMGHTVIENARLPENIIMAVDVTLAYRCPEAVAFATIAASDGDTHE